MLTLTLMLIAMLGSPRVLATTQTAHRAVEVARIPLVVVTSLGPMSPATLRQACRSLLQTLPVRCELRGQEPEADYRHAWNEARQQLDARALLERIFRRRSVDAHVELMLTDVDIYEGERPYVFGLGSLTDRVAVISTSRIHGSANQISERVVKLVRHEVGHAMGLPHHEDRSCVMRSDPTVASLDTAPLTLCESCRMRFGRVSALMSRPGQTGLDHTRGLLVRGELEAARIEAAALAKDADGPMLDELGHLFLRARANDDAIRLLELSVRHSPGLAVAHVHLGLALQQRGRNHDRLRAIDHFDHALNLEPQWDQVQALVLQLRDGMATAQGPRQSSGSLPH